MTNIELTGIKPQNPFFTISEGASRKERRWKQRNYDWETFRERLLTPVVTQETHAEYVAMSRDRQTDVKDVGGFVGGMLKEGLRKKGNITGRWLLTLDYDEFDADHLYKAKAALGDIIWALHSTHKHTLKAWRVRLVLPLSREVLPEEYVAIARLVANRIGMEGIDRSTFEPERLMFWWSCSRDGAQLKAESGEKSKRLDADAVLNAYRNWRDAAEWPKLPEEEAIWQGGGDITPLTGAKGRPQQNPEEKTGVIGAFCRTYSIRQAIETFLGDVYTRGSNGRYTYTLGKTSNGGVVYNDRFFYSNHGTDPAGGKLSNAFDLVRLHKFGDLDYGSPDDPTHPERTKSFKAMTEFALSDAKTRETLRRESRSAAMADFFSYDFSDETAHGEAETDTRDPKEAKTEAEERWKAARESNALKVGADGKVRKSSIEAAMLVLDCHPELTGRLTLNEFSHNIEVKGKLPWKRTGGTGGNWNNNDDAALRGWLDSEFGIIGKDKIADALTIVAARHSYHPIKQYFESLEWDGEKRLERLFTEVIGAENRRLYREIAKLFFVACVHRVYHPGCKFDYFFVIQGEEGSGKSSLFSLMGGEWFTDSIKSIEGKEGMEGIQGRLIAEMGEMIAVKRSEVASIKGFVSSQVDRYRPAYGRVVEERPRICIMVGTTNNEYCLRGLTTGNRREPVVEINPALRTEPTEAREYIKKHRDQLWAEAVACYRSETDRYREGEPLVLPRELWDEVKEIQARHNLDKDNSTFGEIVNFLNMELPYDWDSYTTQERHTFIHTRQPRHSAYSDYDPLLGREDPSRENRARLTVTLPEILQEFLGMKKTDRDYPARGREISQFMRTLADEWEMIGTRRNPRYGNQKTWRRKGGTPGSGMTTGMTTETTGGVLSGGQEEDNIFDL